MDFNREIVAKLAHDIKGALGNIMMFSELLLDTVEAQEGEDPAETLKSVVDIIQNIHLTADRFLETIDSWTDLYSFSEDGVKPKWTDINVDSISDDVINRVKAYAEKKEIEVEVSGEENLEVYFEPHLLKQILNGMLSASVMYAEFKSTIQLQAKAAGARVRFSVLFKTSSNMEHLGRQFTEEVDLNNFETYKQGILKPAVVHPLLANVVLSSLKAPKGYTKQENHMHEFWFELTML